MNNKIIIAIISILFLTVQACSGVSFGGISSGLAAECIGEGRDRHLVIRSSK